MRPVTKLLITILFPAALALPALSALLPVSPAEIENRRVTRPEVTAEAIVDPEFYRDVLIYARDANPSRELMIRVGTGLDYWVFDDSPDPLRVFKGVDDWLFFRRTVDEGCSAPPELVARHLQDLVGELERDVPNLVVTVAPSKYVIHGDRLTADQVQLTQCARDASVRLRTLLAEAEIDRYIDGWLMFQEAREEGRQPYFRTDTHFDYESSIAWMDTLIGEVGDVWDPDAVVDLGDEERIGNLMRFLGLRLPETVRRYEVDRGFPQETETLFGNNARYTTPSHVTEPLIEGVTVIIGDSFMEIPRPSLVQYFRDVTVLDWRDSEAVEYFLETAPNADVVILEISELDIWRLFSNPSPLDAPEEKR